MMQAIPYLDIPALNSAYGEVKIPGSKSISNRALLLAALCAEETLLYGILDSDDTQAMLRSLEKLGCNIAYEDKEDISVGVKVIGLRVQGSAFKANQSNEPIDLFLDNAGTVMRPLTAVLALLGGHYKLSGIARMHERPIGDLVNALRSFGGQIVCVGNEGYPPLLISSPQLNQENLSKPIGIKGNTSSQFLSALLMALPLVAKKNIVIEVEGELISKPYIAITLKVLEDFGIKVINENYQRFTIPAQSQYRSPQTYYVEADASSASYFVALGAIAATEEQPLIIKGVGADSIQGDIRFIEAAKAMGAAVEAHPRHLSVHRQQWPLKAIELDCNHIPDAAMTLAVMALYATGTTKLTNIGSWRVKETDRIDAMKNELAKLGAHVVAGDDYIEVTAPIKWRSAAIETYDDHRMAMCFSLAAFNAEKKSIRVLEPACVNKTYPTYFSDFFKIVQSDLSVIPVITVDGPTASGKGTLASGIAKKLGFHYLDSGALYRMTAFAALEEKITAEDVAALAELAQNLPVKFKSNQVWYKGNDVSELLRAEEVGMMASKIAAYPEVRVALQALQQSFQRLPGLVADGRDMGTVIFKEAPLKIYLTADADARAKRRYTQLKAKGISAKIEELHADLKARDDRDMNRSVAPLKPAEDAKRLDNSELTADESITLALSWWEKQQPL